MQTWQRTCTFCLRRQLCSRRATRCLNFATLSDNLASLDSTAAHWCIAVYFRFLASKALHCALYHAEHFFSSQLQPWMLIILTCTQLVLLSISNVLVAVLCLSRFWAPRSAMLTTGPTHMSALAIRPSCQCTSHTNAPLMRMQFSYQCTSHTNALLIPMHPSCECNSHTNALLIPMHFSYQCTPHTNGPVQPNLLPWWQPSLQPSLQLESPFLWPLWSMCTSSESNTPARKSGTQSLLLSRAEHASQQAVPGSFCFS